jgi:branched-chain amino acid transport system substrate-binding protein
MRRTRVATAAAVALLALVGGCGGGGSSDGDTIKLGAWYPLSGPQASSGVPQELGARVFWKQLNASGGINGKKVTFIAKDNAFDPQQTIQIARELIGRDKVAAIVTANGTATTEATFPYVLNQSKVPIFGTYGGSEAWYAKDAKPGLYGTQALYEDQARVAVKWAVDEGAKNVLIVRDDPDAFANVGKVAGAQVQKDGATSSELVVKLGTTDYSPVLSQVKKKSPDAVFLILPPQEAAAYLKEAALQKVDIQAYGYAPTATETTVELAGAAAEGFRAAALTLPPTSDDPAIAEYRAAMAKYAPKSDPDFYSLASYGAAKVFAEILKSIEGPVNSRSITEAINSAKDITTGIAPPMSFDPDSRLGTRAVARVEVKDGVFVADGEFEGPTQ